MIETQSFSFTCHNSNHRPPAYAHQFQSDLSTRELPEQQELLESNDTRSSHKAENILPLSTNKSAKLRQTSSCNFQTLPPHAVTSFVQSELPAQERVCWRPSELLTDSLIQRDVNCSDNQNMRHVNVCLFKPNLSLCLPLAYSKATQTRQSDLNAVCPLDDVDDHIEEEGQTAERAAVYDSQPRGLMTELAHPSRVEPALIRPLVSAEVKPALNSSGQTNITSRPTYAVYPNLSNSPCSAHDVASSIGYDDDEACSSICQSHESGDSPTPRASTVVALLKLAGVGDRPPEAVPSHNPASTLVQSPTAPSQPWPATTTAPQRCNETPPAVASKQSVQVPQAAVSTQPFWTPRAAAPMQPLSTPRAAAPKQPPSSVHFAASSAVFPRTYASLSSRAEQHPPRPPDSARSLGVILRSSGSILAASSATPAQPVAATPASSWEVPGTRGASPTSERALVQQSARLRTARKLTDRILRSASVTGRQSDIRTTYFAVVGAGIVACKYYSCIGLLPVVALQSRFYSLSAMYCSYSI